MGNLGREKPYSTSIHHDTLVFNLKSLCLFLYCHSKDPLPSLSTVRRDEVDDIYVLPALPAVEEKDKSRSEVPLVS